MNVYIGYTLLGQIIWGLLPLFWMLLQDISAFYILATRIVWSALFCYALIIQKRAASQIKSRHTMPTRMAIYSRRLHYDYPELGDFYLCHDTSAYFTV